MERLPAPREYTPPDPAAPAPAPSTAPPPPPPPQPAASREDGGGADQSRPDGAAQKQPVSDAGVSDFDLL